MKKVILALFFVSVMAFVAAPALASPITVGDPLWYEFAFGAVGSIATNGLGTIPSDGGNSQYAPDEPWTFSAPISTVLTIVDAFLEGDVFTVFDFGVPVGTTTLVANTGNDSGTNDPEVALGIFDLSRGFFSLGPGSHSLTFQVAQAVSPGAAFFRVDLPECCPNPVPIPGALVLFGSGLVGLVAVGRRWGLKV